MMKKTYMNPALEWMLPVSADVITVSKAPLEDALEGGNDDFITW